MLIYKIIGFLMIFTALAWSIASWLREYLREKRRRRDRRFARKRRNAYKENFRSGAMRDIEDWRGENEPEKKQNIICKNPAFAAAWK